MQQPVRQQRSRNKQILFIIATYLLFTMFSNVSIGGLEFQQSMIEMIQNKNKIELSPKDILSKFTYYSYVGRWQSTNEAALKMLDRGNGKVKMRFQKYENLESFEFQFQINNGDYIDNGFILIKTALKAEDLGFSRKDNSISLSLKKNENKNETTIQKLPQAYFSQQKILKNIVDKTVSIQDFILNISYIQQDKKLTINFNIITIQHTTTLGNHQLEFQISILKQESQMISTIIFAILLFIISFMEFSAVMEMLRAMFEGREGAQTYSLVTVLMATMWDAVVCVVAFIEAFGKEESLILFIIPAFLLCLLFTNLQLRVLLMIFQARSNGRPLRDIVCKFNLITYGSLILMYPIMKFTNLGTAFFLGISLIFLPQIYSNAKRGQRPNIQNPYYTKFLTYRFLIIFYLKCFPWNIFEMEPNYLLSFSCLALLAFQLLLLWIQKNYGPKKVIPKFLLPPVFNYNCEIQANLQEGVQTVECAICLASLHQDPEPSGSNNIKVPFRIMKGPCAHMFHGPCLSQWMQIKMQCPQCRSKLPPFQ